MNKLKDLLLIALVYSTTAFSQYDWDHVPVPAYAGDGKVWELQENVSDDFNYIFEETESQVNFGDDKWYNFYHNTWDGPGRTYWKQNHTSVNGSELVLRTSDSYDTRKGFNCANAACITSNNRVQYPVFVEGSISVANIAIASDIWMLSPDDTEEIDIIECYGGTPWFEQYIHLSHHSFIRNPFHDYQPRDVNSWWPDNDFTGGSWGDYCWNDGNRRYIRVGVYWIGPNHLEYYVNGQLARVMYEHATATQMYGTWEYTYYNDQYPVGYKDEYGTNLGGMPTTTNGYTDITLHTTTAEYDFATLQATSAASNAIKVLDPGDYQGADVGFTKELDIVINVEIQSWHLGDAWVIDDEDLAKPISDVHVDWIRAYKPVDGVNNVTAVNVTPASVATGVGQERNISVEVLPLNAIDKSVTWSSDNPTIATVDQNGVVTGVTAGFTTIRAINTTGTSGNVIGSCSVTVLAEIASVPIANISLAAPRLRAEPGDQLALMATILPIDASDKSLTWSSSDVEVATVNAATGLLTGVANGVVTVTATANDGSGISASIDIEIEEFIPASIVIDNPEQYLAQAYVVGDELTISCTYHAGSGNVIDHAGVRFMLRRIAAGWASVIQDYTVSDLSTVGTQSGTATGTITLNVPTTDAIGSDFYFLYVSAQEGGFDAPGIAPIIIVAEEIPITDVTISPATISTGIGQSRGLSIEVLPELVTDPTIVWSSDNESIVTVDQDGVITGVSTGTTTVRATASNGVAGTCDVTVQTDPVYIPVSSIMVSASQQSALPDQTITLSAEILPPEATDKTVTWSSSDPAIASVDPESGVVSTHDFGSVLITATAHNELDVSGIVELRIETEQEASITVPNPDQYTATAYVVDDELTVTADFHAGTGNTIDGNGITFWLRRMSAGWGSVIDDFTASDLSAAGKEFGTATASISLEGVPPSDEIGTDFYFLWITANGNTIVHSGFHPITVTDEAVLVESVSVSPTAAETAVGETVELVATITPGNASNKQVNWESDDESIATVENGIVTAVGEGVATITVTTVDGNKTATSTITVEIIHVDGVSIDPVTAELDVNEDLMLVATITPTNASNKAVTWESSNEAIATVDANGLVSAVGEGDVSITVTTDDGGETATSNITVNFIDLIDVALEPSALELIVGEEITLVPQFTPTNASNKSVTWESTDERAATVNANGLVTAIDEGITTIRVTTDNGAHIAEVTLTVEEPVDVETIDISPAEHTLFVGENQQLDASVLPEDAYNKSITWSSGNGSIASVNASGLVTGTGEGVVTITASATDGSGVTGTATITVESVDVTSISVSAPSQMFVDDEEQLSITVLPSNATNKTVTWSSGDDDIATVSSTGLVTAASAGEVTITATANDGSGVTGHATITVNNNIISIGEYLVDWDPVNDFFSANPSIPSTHGSEILNHVQDLGYDVINPHNTPLIVYGTVEGVLLRHPMWQTDSWLTFDAAGLVVGDEYEISVIINGQGSNTGDWSWYKLKLDAWETGSSPDAVSGSDDYHISSAEYPTAPGRDGSDSISASARFTITNPNTTFGIGVTGNQGSTSIISWSIRKVGGAAVPVTGVTLSQSEVYMDIDETITLEAVISPSTATNKNVSWSSSDEEVATVNGSGLVTAVGLGDATITVTTADGGFTAFASIDVDIELNITRVASASLGVFAYPNPVKNTLFINGIANEAIHVKMFSSQGNLVIDQVITDEIDVSHLINGVYILQFRGNTINESRRIVIQK